MTLFESNYYYTEFIKNSPPPLVDKKIINIIFKQEYQPILTLLNTKLKKISNLKKFLKNYIPSCEFEKDDNEKIMDFVFNFWNILRTELPKDKIPKKYKNVKVFIDYLRLPSGNTGKDIFNKYIKGKKLLGIIKANTLLIKDISNPQLIKTRKKSTKKRGQNYCSLSKNKLLIIFKKLNQSIDSSKSKDLQKKLRDVLIQTGQIIHEQENIELNAYMKTQNMDFF